MISALLVPAGIQSANAQPPAASAADNQFDLAKAMSELPPAHNTELNLQPNTRLVLRLIEKLWPYYANGGPIYGWRQDAIPDHPSGQALDVMLKDDGRTESSVAEGNSIAGFLLANHEQLGIDYMMFRQHIWHPDSGWSPTRDYGNWTDNHMNHIHVLTYGSHVPSGELVPPEPVNGVAMPDIAGIKAAHDNRVKLLQASVIEKTNSLNVALAAGAASQRVRAQSLATTDEAQRTVNDLVRETYMFGADVELVTSAMGIFSDPSTVGASDLVVNHVRRGRAADYAEAKKLLRLANRKFAEQQAAIALAQQALDAVKLDLTTAQQPFSFETLPSPTDMHLDSPQ